MNSTTFPGKVAALVLCAGTGKRFGGKKQFMLLGDKPLWEWSVKVFQDAPQVNEIILVVPPEDTAWVATSVGDRFPKLKHIVPGGPTRYDSSYNGLLKVSGETEWVMVHDGARPFIAPGEVARVLQAAFVHGAAVPGLVPKDTIKKVGADGLVDKTLRREGLRAIQTPQAFRVDVIRSAYSRIHGKYEPNGFPDDASVVEAAGHPVAVVDGSESNFKVTTPDDWLRAVSESGSQTASWAAMACPIRVGIGYDVHRLAAGRDLILGGVHIPYRMGLEGHSDADVLTHALMDALLGAAGEADIGSLFPVTDERYTGANSLGLLQEVVRIICAKGFLVGSVDITVIAEEPKISPYVSQIKDSLSPVLGISSDRVGVKASTNEGLGFIGRGEGISCFAAATILAVGRLPQGHGPGDIQ